MLSNNKIIIVAIVAIMGLMLFLRTKTESPVVQPLVTLKSSAEGAMPGTALPAGADSALSGANEGGQGESGYKPLQQGQTFPGQGEAEPAQPGGPEQAQGYGSTEPRGPVPQDITGLPKMPYKKCMDIYGQYPKVVAFYARNSNTVTSDYAMCHTIVERDDTFCGFVVNAEETCRRTSQNYRLTYSAAIKKFDTTLCQTYFGNTGRRNNQASGQPPTEQVCKGFNDVVTGKTQPDAKWAKYFRFLSGSASDCSALSGPEKADCVLLADVISGVKGGTPKLWLYDALSGRGCEKADQALVELYCSGKIQPPARSEPSKGKKKPAEASESGE